VRRIALSLVAGLLLVALLPCDGWAWSPGTHVLIGQSVLANLAMLPAATAQVLRAFPHEFLYGSIAADTSLAKRYAPAGRHSHAWHVGAEIVDLAPDASLYSFGLGYLAHLAADVVAHNFFIPRQLVLTSSTRALGHLSWETRFDMHLSDRYLRTAREVMLWHSEAADDHLDRIISPTIFSVGTNRRLFRGMVRLSDTAGWQRVVWLAAEASRWDLSAGEVERNVAVSYDLVMDLLACEREAEARRYDPSGTAALAAAKRTRRLALGNGGRDGPGVLREIADEHFGLPRLDLGYWERRDAPRVGAAEWPRWPRAARPRFRRKRARR
jgi:hypothetical protein